MEEQQAGFNVSEEGVELLAQILDFASQTLAPDHDWESGPADLSDDQQDLVLRIAGGVLVEILRQTAGMEEA